MSRNVIAGGAAQRAIAGLLSLALVSGGLVVPLVANAAEETGKAVCNSEGVAPRPRGDAPKGMSLNRDVYKIGDVVEIKITGLTDITAKHKLRLTLSGAQWPTDQSAGDGLELVEESPVLDIPTSKIENGEVTVKAVLPSEFEGVFRPGKNILIAQLEDGTKVTGVRGVEVWVNESGKAAGACGPENPNGDKPEPEDAPASDDSNQGNAEQPGNENQDGKSADQDNKDQGTKPSDQGNKDQDSKDQGDDNPSDQSGKDQDDKAQSSKDQSDKGQDGTSAGQDNKDQAGKNQPGNNEQASVEKPAGQDGKPAEQDNKDQGSKPTDQASKDQASKDQSSKDQNTKDQGTKPADQGGKDQGTKPSGQNKPADQADKDQGGKDQAGKDQSGKPADQPGKDQDGKNQGPQDPKDPKITPSTQFSQLSSVRGIVGSIFAVLGLTALFAGALGVMAKYNVIPANWIPQQLRHLSR